MYLGQGLRFTAGASPVETEFMRMVPVAPVK